MLDDKLQYTSGEHTKWQPFDPLRTNASWIAETRTFWERAETRFLPSIMRLWRLCSESRELFRNPFAKQRYLCKSRVAMRWGSMWFMYELWMSSNTCSSSFLGEACSAKREEGSLSLQHFTYKISHTFSKVSLLHSPLERNREQTSGRSIVSSLDIGIATWYDACIHCDTCTVILNFQLTTTSLTFDFHPLLQWFTISPPITQIHFSSNMNHPDRLTSRRVTGTRNIRTTIEDDDYDHLDSVVGLHSINNHISSRVSEPDSPQSLDSSPLSEKPKYSYKHDIKVSHSLSHWFSCLTLLTTLALTFADLTTKAKRCFKTWSRTSNQSHHLQQAGHLLDHPCGSRRGFLQVSSYWSSRCHHVSWILFLCPEPSDHYSWCLSSCNSFDEVHFGKFTSYYLKREFFFDVHPPLAKLMLAFQGWIVGYDGSYPFENIGDSYLDSNVPYVQIRAMPAFIGSLTASLVYAIMKESGYPPVVNLLSSFLIALGTFSEFAHLSPPIHSCPRIHPWFHC